MTLMEAHMAFDTMRQYVAAAGLAAALSLGVVQPGDAAVRWHGDRAGGQYQGLYNYAPGGEDYQSRNGTPFGPPDPASCGGYRC